MDSLKCPLSQKIFHQNPQTSKHHLCYSVVVPCRPIKIITCGLRGGPRGPMWRSRVLSTEAIQVVQSLKLAKSSTKLDEVFSRKLSRLLKADLLDTLAELQRQSELELALKVLNSDSYTGCRVVIASRSWTHCLYLFPQVFEFVRKEVWYTPDLSLYCGMILLLGKKKLIVKAEELFSELKKEGLQPDTRTYTEMIGAYLHMGKTEKAMEMYALMKASGCTPDELTFTILIRNLEKAGEDDLATTVKKECVDYVDSPKKFLEQVERKYPKRRSLNLV